MKVPVTADADSVSANLVRPLIGWPGIGSGLVIDSCLRIAKANDVRGGALIFTQTLTASLRADCTTLVGALRWNVAWSTGR